MAGFLSRIVCLCARASQVTQQQSRELFARSRRPLASAPLQGLERLEDRLLLTVSTPELSQLESDDAPMVQIIDNGDAGFSTYGNWTAYQMPNAPVYQSDFAFVWSGGNEQATTWTFDDLEPGRYEVSASWTGAVFSTQNAPYEVFDGDASVARTVVNQQVTSSGSSARSGGNFEVLAESVEINSGMLMVRLDAPLDGFTMADAVRIERIPDVVDDGVAFFVPGAREFSGDEGDFDLYPHTSDLELTDGTISFTFTVEETDGWQALFSKDAQGTEVDGHLTAFVVGDRIKVRFQTAEKTRWFETAEGTVTAGAEHHFAFTFGESGAWLYLDGLMRDWNQEFTQGLSTNTEELAIGANIWARSEENPLYATNELSGTIVDFTIYDTQYDRHQIAKLAGVEPERELKEPTVIDRVLVGTLQDDTQLYAEEYGVHAVFGDYGNDVLIANPTLPAAGVALSDGEEIDDDLSRFANILNGGHGNDRLIGSEHADLLISRADGREPKIAQEWNEEDDPYGEIDLESNTYYVGQPIEGDDVMVGGGGADLFYFQTLINAKEHIILQHVNDDGTINWGMNGVAGENDNVHDHWVDGLGDELIADFNREEGDHILIEGHTTEVYKVEYVDSDGDGIVDSTVMHIWSNQGNGGGAHNKDLLGTITAAGVLLTSEDYTVNKRDHGIVPTIAELDEAITPYSWISDDGVGPVIPPVDDGEATPGVALSVPGATSFNGENDEYVTIEHHDALELTDGTISFTFTVEETDGWQALFSKDAQGTEVDGHLTAFVVGDRIKVRLQNGEVDKWLYSDEGSIVGGERYHVAIGFGAQGFQLYLNGELVDARSEFTQGLQANQEPLVLGANIWGRSEEKPLWARDELTGTISDFTIFGRQLSEAEIAQQVRGPSIGEFLVFIDPVDLTDDEVDEDVVDRVFGDLGG